MKTLENLSYEEIDTMTGSILDAYIGKYLFGFRGLERSLMGDYYYGGVSEDSGRYSVPECTTNANAIFNAVNKAIDNLPFLGDIFIEYWHDKEWFVCNRPLGHRNDAICASCDGKETGKPDIKLAVCRFLVKSLKNNQERENGNRIS